MVSSGVNITLEIGNTPLHFKFDAMSNDQQKQITEFQIRTGRSITEKELPVLPFHFELGTNVASSNFVTGELFTVDDGGKNEQCYLKQNVHPRKFLVLYDI